MWRLVDIAIAPGAELILAVSFLVGQVLGVLDGGVLVGFFTIFQAVCA